MSGCRSRGGAGDIGIVKPPTGPSEPAKPKRKESSEIARLPEGAVELPDENLVTVHFDYDKYEIRPDAAEVLDSNASWIKANLDKGEFHKIKIEGHCDERGTNKYNQVLGERRANAARNFLINQGVPSDILVPISYGEESPVDTGHSEEAWRRNRRAEFKKVIAK